jgi:hypothetical protein
MTKSNLTRHASRLRDAPHLTVTTDETGLLATDREGNRYRRVAHDGQAVEPLARHSPGTVFHYAEGYGWFVHESDWHALRTAARHRTLPIDENDEP